MTVLWRTLKKTK